MATDLPYKILNAILFNTIIYFMTSASLTALRRSAGRTSPVTVDD